MDNLIIKDPAAWRAAELREKSDWIHHLTAAEVAEIESALACLKQSGHSFDSATRADFPLPRFAAVLEQISDALENGYGIKVIRGLPAERWSKEEMRLIFWGLGLHLGTAVCQTYNGEYLGDVRHFGENTGRLYNSNIAGGFHADSTDVVALCVMRTAKAGGRSLIASTLAIHNEIARTRPDLLAVLYEPFPWLSVVPDKYLGDRPRVFMQPMFSRVGNKFSSLWLPVLVQQSQRIPDAPCLTDAQREALELVDKLANSDEFMLDMMFEPGDIQLINNHVLIHGRTAFEDYDEPERRRHLLRLWLSMPNSRPLSPAVAPSWHDIRPGAVRGGIGAECGKRIYCSFEQMPT